MFQIQIGLMQHFKTIYSHMLEITSIMWPIFTRMSAVPVIWLKSLSAIMLNVIISDS